MHDDDYDELITQDCHAEHFLSRAMRVTARELERAMSLYHHSGVVRAVLGDLMSQGPAGPPSGDERVAIALSDRGGGHIIVTAKGDFVTCLADGMRLSGVTVVPFDVFSGPIATEDARRKDVVVERDQLSRLSPSACVQALLSGPGGVTREMAQIIARRPQTYVMPVWITLNRVVQIENRFIDRRKDFIDAHWRGKLDKRAWHKLERPRKQFAAILNACLLILSSADSSRVLETMRVMARTPHVLTGPSMFALAHQEVGGTMLEEILRDPKAHPSLRIFAIMYIGVHAHYYPRNLAAIASRALQDPPKGVAPCDELLILQSFAGANPDDLENDPAPDFIRLNDHHEEGPKDHEWNFGPLWHVRLARRKATLVDFFPPAERTEAVRAAWAELCLKPPSRLPNKPVVQQVVRQQPRMSRNEPCPCNSGRKYKHCCLDRPAAEQPAQQGQS